jgi:hypothetical protein
MRLALVSIVLVPFALFSGYVVATMGLTNLFEVSAREPWALQMLIDIYLAISLFCVWMVKDARERGIPAWPYVIASLSLGSVGALAYLVHRELKGTSTTRTALA